MKRILSVLILAVIIHPTTSPAQEASLSTAVPEAVEGITARELGAHMTFLASDLMRGRDTASTEIRIAAEYLATRLQALGAEPAGTQDGDKPSYFQPFPLEFITPKVEGTSLALIIEQDQGRRVVPWELFHDFLPLGRDYDSSEREAPLVFAGRGLPTDGADRNGKPVPEVKNRFVLFFSSTSQADREEARKQGALGLILIREPGETAQPSSDLATRRRNFERTRMRLGGRPAAIPTLILEDHARDALAEAAGLDLSDEKQEPRILDGLRIRFKESAAREIKHDRNVVGLFPGSDPEKKNEVIVYSAHYDHVGVDEQGQIYNGADDNASGTSALLEIAEAFAEGPRPARSVAFLWVSGEERGLLGSAYFADHVTLPKDSKIVANINLDMVSRNDPHTVSITPSEKHGDYSTLIPAAQAALQSEEIEAKFDADIYYARTDSYNFAKKSIPVVFFFSGLHDDYHQPTDELDKSDFDKAARIARAAYRLGWQVAQDAEAPKKIPAPDDSDSNDPAGENDSGADAD